VPYWSQKKRFLLTIRSISPPTVEMVASLQLLMAMAPSSQTTILNVPLIFAPYQTWVDGWGAYRDDSTKAKPKFATGCHIKLSWSVVFNRSTPHNRPSVG